MANAALDENSVATLIGVLNSDGASIVRVKVNASTHALKVNNGVGGTDNGPARALHDENHRPTLLALSTDDTTLLAAYVDSSGNLLIKST